jgi:hypothetical protein
VSGVGWYELMGMITTEPDQLLNCTKVSYLFSFHKVILFLIYSFVLSKVYIVFNKNIPK